MRKNLNRSKTYKYKSEKLFNNKNVKEKSVLVYSVIDK